MKNNLKKLLNNDRWTHWGYCKNFPRVSISLATAALFVLTSAARPSHANDHHDHGYNFRIVAKLGDLAPGGGTHEGDLEPKAINENGGVSFASDLSEFPDGTGEGLFLRRHGVNTQVIRTGLPAPGTGTTFGPLILGTSGINDSGDMAFAFMLDYPDPSPLPLGKIAGVWRYDASHSTVKKVLGQGDPAPGGTTFQGTSSSPDINNNGVVATTGIINTDKGNCRDPMCFSPPHTLGLGRGIYTADRRNRISKIIAPGDPAPGTSSTIDDAAEPNINDSGDVVFSAHVAGETCGYDIVSAMGCFTSLYLYRSSTGQISSIAHQGNPAPGGGNFRYVVDGQINNRRDMAYIGDLATVPDYRIVIPGVFFTDRKGISRTVARPGDSLPGGVMAGSAGGEGNLGLNNSGVVAFVAQLDADVNGDSIPDTGVYVDHGGTITTVVRTGTVIPGLGTVAHTNNSYSVGSGLYNLSPGVDINNRGEVLTQVILENGDTYAVVASPQGNNLGH